MGFIASKHMTIQGVSYTPGDEVLNFEDIALARQRVLMNTGFVQPGEGKKKQVAKKPVPTKEAKTDG